MEICNEECYMNNTNFFDEQEYLVKSIVPPGGQCVDRLQRLVRWLLQGGAKFPKCQIRHLSDNCRATFASQPIQPNEEIIYIPKKFIITSEVYTKSPICKAIENSGIKIRSKHSYLASFLLQERDRGENSEWFPYIDILPKKFDNIPLFFSEVDLEQLEGSMSITKMKDRHESLFEEYSNLCKYVPGYDRWSYDEFMWGRLVVITRIFGLLIDGVKTDGLVPMADMVNHRRPRETRWTFDQQKRGFIVSSLQYSPAGAQIYDSYGRKCNSRFFVNYGFALENNPDNEACIKIRFNKHKNPHYFNSKKSSSMIKLKKMSSPSLNTSGGVDHQIHQIPTSYEDKKVRDLFSYLRTQLSNVSHSEEEKNSDQYLRPVTIESELNVLMLLNQACTDSLSLFKDSLVHDNQLLANTTLYPYFSNSRNIILMRRGEKQVLHHWINFCNHGTKALHILLDNSHDNGHLYIHDSNINNYINELYSCFNGSNHPTN